MPVIPLLGVAEAGEVGVRGHPGLYTETHVGFGVNLVDSQKSERFR